MKSQAGLPEKICVMGLGYIGLPTASLLANCGYSVHGVDVHPHIVSQLNKGKIHIMEPDLEHYVSRAVKEGNFHASLEPCEADVFIICVPTPFKKGADSLPVPDLSFVLKAARSIAPFLRKGNAVILESTCPVGSTERVIHEIRNAEVAPEGVHFAYCPERVLPGNIMRELVQNDRIVGGFNPEATEVISTFYKSFINGEVLETDARTAEMCKLVENASRDVQIAFANELSMICDDVDVNVRELINLANHHPRVNILKPGCGVGGHCIAVDPWFLVSQSPEKARLIRTAREVNDHKADWVVQKVLQASQEWEKSHGRAARITCMGLSFKPDIEDLRESPALYIAKKLAAEAEHLSCCEPHVQQLSGLTLIEQNEVNEQSDMVVVLVAHSCFRHFGRNENLTVLDFCGLFNS